MSDRFPDLPASMRRLPVDKRGFPVPWFVPWQDGEPIFPAQEAGKAELAWQRRLCWVCGGELLRLSAFVIGPMCGINRTSSEPPSHLECARFSARNCPFLSRPRMKRTMDLNAGGRVAGHGIDRNPGVTLVWIVKTLSRGRPFWAGNGYLYELGKPHSVEWYREGRFATHEEVMESITTGLPLLEEMVDQDPDRDGAAAELERRKEACFKLLPVAA